MSILSLTAEYRNGRTVITESRFTAPLKTAMPFYHDKFTEIMMMSASAGILDGDSYEISITVRENASLKFTGQSYTKIFKADKKGASQRVRISVEKGGTLIYAPCPVIPFGGSIFDSRAQICLSSESRFAMTDILSAGRIAMKESFAFKSFRSRTAVYIDGKLKYLDNRRLVPEEAKLSEAGFFEGYTHSGSAYIYGADKYAVEDILSRHDGEEIAVSEAAAGLSIRSAGNSAHSMSHLFDKLTEII